jgi:uncharacterized protein (TIGR02231 family)
MDRIEATVPVAEVTVLEDRAQVLRRGRVDIPAGISELVVTGVAPVLADKTLVAHAGEGVRVVDVRCRRTPLPALSDPARPDAQVQERLLAARRRVEALEAEQVRVAAMQELAASAGSLAVAEMAADAAAGRDDLPAWREAMDAAAGREQAAGRRVAAIALDLEVAQREVADIEERLAAQGGPRPMRAEIVVLLEAAAAGGAGIELGYVVPGACWRPAHTARLGDGAVAWTVEACVWQRTGEDWDGVRLFLSTDRASLGGEPPELQPDYLQLRPREQAVVVEARDRVVEDTGPGGGPAAQMPGIDDGGEVRVLPVPDAAVVPGDGQPHRLPIAVCTMPATLALVVHPELLAAAVLRTRLANPLPMPLLAGPVDLIRDGGLAGRGSIAYVAPGAGFDLGWGGDAAVRVRRSAQAVEEKPSALSAWTPRRHEVDVVLLNLGGEAKTLVVAERIPVSELEQVRVELDAAETRPPATADADGICRWEITLAPRGRSEVRLRWRLLTKGAVAGV